MPALVELATLLVVSFCLNGIVAVGTLGNSENYFSSHSQGSESPTQGDTQPFAWLNTGHGHVIVHRSIDDHIPEPYAEKHLYPILVTNDGENPFLQTMIRENVRKASIKESNDNPHIPRVQHVEDNIQIAREIIEAYLRKHQLEQQNDNDQLQTVDVEPWSMRPTKGGKQILSDDVNLNRCNHNPASIMFYPFHPSLQAYVRNNYIGSSQPGEVSPVEPESRTTIGEQGNVAAAVAVSGVSTAQMNQQQRANLARAAAKRAKNLSWKVLFTKTRERHNRMLKMLEKKMPTRELLKRARESLKKPGKNWSEYDARLKSLLLLRSTGTAPVSKMKVNESVADAKEEHKDAVAAAAEASADADEAKEAVEEARKEAAATVSVDEKFAAEEALAVAEEERKEAIAAADEALVVAKNTGVALKEAQKEAAATRMYDGGMSSSRSRILFYPVGLVSLIIDCQEAPTQLETRMPKRRPRKRSRGRRRQTSTSKRRKSRRRRRRLRKRKNRHKRSRSRNRKNRHKRPRSRDRKNRHKRPRSRDRKNRHKRLRSRDRKNRHKRPRSFEQGFRKNNTPKRPRFGGPKVRKYSRHNSRRSYFRRSAEIALEQAKEEHREAVATAAEASVDADEANEMVAEAKEETAAAASADEEAAAEEALVVAEEEQKEAAAVAEEAIAVTKETKADVEEALEDASRPLRMQP